MSKLGDMWAIFRNLWSLRASDGTDADVLRMTQKTMDDLGIGGGTTPALDDEAINVLLDPDWDDLWKDDFKLTQGQLMLMRRARLNWNSVEIGAPQLNPDQPYTDGTTPRHLTELLGDEAQDMEKADFLISMVQAYSTFCGEAKIDAGTYQIRNVTIDDVAAAAWNDQERIAWFGQNPDGSFDLTEDLIALVRNLQWQWPDEDDMGDVLYKGEVAGPTVNPKRPYGDMSYFQLDIHRILGWPTELKTEDGYVELTDAQGEAAMDLHFRTMLAAQVMLENGRVEVTNG